MVVNNIDYSDNEGDKNNIDNTIYYDDVNIIDDS